MSRLQQARLAAIVNQARQRVPEFERRLDRLAALSPDGQRKFINKTGSHSRATPSRDLEHRLMLYGQRRLGTVAREMVLLHEMKRRDALTARTRIECKGAFWQAFQGTVEQPACHTSPGLLLFAAHGPGHERDHQTSSRCGVRRLHAHAGGGQQAG